MTDKVKKYEFSSDKYKTASFEIKDNKCEICQKPSMNGQTDNKGQIRYACLDHHDDLFKKIRNE